MIKHGEDQIKDFERSQALSVWTDSQMVKHLREQGYKVEKRRPNPKKSKRKR